MKRRSAALGQVKLIPMIPHLDIWRAANLLIQQHGANAEIVAAQRADEMLERNDLGGHLVWLRIVTALRELRAPPTGLPN
jgi:hypothetical protein